MQVQDTNLLNSLLQVGGPKLNADGTANLGVETSSEFASLLGEAQQLSKESIDPKLLMSSLEDETLNLIPEEKEIIKDVLLGKTSDAEVTELLREINGEAKTGEALNKEQASLTAMTELSEVPSKENKVLTKEESAKLAETKAFFANDIKQSNASKEQAIINKLTKEEIALKNSTPLDEAKLETPVKSKEVTGRMKNAQFLTGALPATKPTKSKANLQLVQTSGEDFVNAANKVKAQKTVLPQDAMPKDLSMKGQIAAYAQEKEMLDNNVIKLNKVQNTEALSGELVGPKSDLVQSDIAVDQVSSSILNVDGRQKANTAAKATAATQVLNLSDMSPSNTEQIISKVSDYIQQASFNNRDSLDLVVKHDSLGQFNVNVNKLNGDQALNLQITAAASEGHKFFVDNEVELVKSLNQAGIKLGDLKISSSADSSGTSNEQKNSSDNNNMFGKSSQSSSQDQREDSDSRRRKELWEEYKYRMGA